MSRCVMSKMCTKIPAKKLQADVDSNRVLALLYMESFTSSGPERALD